MAKSVNQRRPAAAEAGEIPLARVQPSAQPNAEIGELPPWSSVPAFAAYIAVHERSVRRWLSESRIKAVKAGGRLRIARSEIERFLAGGCA